MEMKKMGIICLLLTLCLGACTEKNAPNKSDSQNYAYKNGVVDVEFAVSPTKKVKFSQGNLQYNPSENQWRFADNQWITISKTENNNVSQYYDGWIDLFGWATNGVDNHQRGGNHYMPWDTQREDSKESEYAGRISYSWHGDHYDSHVECRFVYNRYGYGPSLTVDKWPKYSIQAIHYGSSFAITCLDSTEFSFDNYTGEYDWGYNMGKESNIRWRTLTKQEWVYLIENNMCSMATVYGVKGFLLTHKDWTKPQGVSAFTRYNTNSNVNLMTEEESAILLSSGAVFFPAGDYWTATTRNGISYIDYDIDFTKEHESICMAIYYTIRYYSISDLAFYTNIQKIKECARYYRNYVRLVCDVQ